MRVSCPFCNHAFETADRSRGVECPRCGETLPSQLGSAIAESQVDRGSDSFKSQDRPADRSAVLAVAAVIAVLVLVVTGFFLLFVTSMKPKDKAFPSELPAWSADAAAPLDLAGLNHLPANCNIVFAIQTGPLLVYAERTHQDPVELLTKNGIPAPLLGAIASANITLQQIDHIAGGLLIPDKDEELRIAFVLVLRRPLANDAAFLHQLLAKQTKPGRFDVQLDKFTLRMSRVSDAIWAFGFSEKDLAAGSLSPDFRQMIGVSVPREAAAWVAFDYAWWSKKPLFAALFNAAAWSPDRIAIVAKGRSGTLAYSFADPPLLSAAIRTSDAEAATDLRTYFKGKATGEHAKSSGEGDWASLVLPAAPKDLSPIIKDFISDIGR
jgi:hypothetical protein